MDATQRMKWYWAGGTIIGLVGLVVLLAVAGSVARTANLTSPISSLPQLQR